MRGGDFKIRVYGFRKDEQGIMDVGNDLKSEQEFVGGRIGVYPVTDELILIHNDDGFNDGLEPRAIVLGEGEGNAIDLRGIREIIGEEIVYRAFHYNDVIADEKWKS